MVISKQYHMGLYPNNTPSNNIKPHSRHKGKGAIDILIDKNLTNTVCLYYTVSVFLQCDYNKRSLNIKFLFYEKVKPIHKQRTFADSHKR